MTDKPRTCTLANRFTFDMRDFMSAYNNRLGILIKFKNGKEEHVFFEKEEAVLKDFSFIALNKALENFNKSF